LLFRIQIGQRLIQVRAGIAIDQGLQAAFVSLAVRTARQIEQAGRDILVAESAVSELYVEKERAQEDNRLLKEHAGRDGYTEAREFIEKAVTLMEQSSFDLANGLLDKAQDALKA